MQQDRGIRPEFLGKKHQASDDMTDDEDRQIGRSIVGPLMEEFFAALRADVVDLEIGAEHPAFAAAGTAAAQSSAARLPCIAGRFDAPPLMRGAWNFSRS